MFERVLKTSLSTAGTRKQIFLTLRLGIHTEQRYSTKLFFNGQTDIKLDICLYFDMNLRLCKGCY